ncbi:hypothetical protein KSS94_11455 [Pseudomonas fakonensis]|uniref:Uncharacterized protein n=1 Tax=Pseudomonas fakonensis TaxID=2842355 RepID=A0ABX8NC93_9PSED|nr:hypothetical protein [Pseudomonas fakonensis]QXH53687.1 hypothetical protein KSS94_11455 [Pseudomonas fakonensis]
MIVFFDFDELNTFNCTYGGSEEKAGALRVFVKGGLALPYGVFLEEKNGTRFVKCEKDKAESVGNIFPIHYIYDPSRRVEYVEWELSEDGFLRARTSSGEWVQYTSKSDSQYAMHEFVGGFWFVFEGVVFSKRITTEYTADREKSTGNEVIQEFGSRSCVEALSKKYFLEGVLEVQPGSGWMSWEIYAKSFHIEIPDV